MPLDKSEDKLINVAASPLRVAQPKKKVKERLWLTNTGTPRSTTMSVDVDFRGTDRDREAPVITGLLFWLGLFLRLLFIGSQHRFRVLERVRAELGNTWPSEWRFTKHNVLIK